MAGEGPAGGAGAAATTGPAGGVGDPAPARPSRGTRTLGLLVVLVGLLLAVATGEVGGVPLLVAVMACGLAALTTTLSASGFRLRGTDLPPLALVLGLLPSACAAPTVHLTLLGVTRALALAGFALAAARLASWDDGHRRAMVGVLASVAVVGCVVGLAQMVAPSPMPGHWLDPTQRAVIPFRVTSVFVNPNLWGAACAVVVVAAGAEAAVAGERHDAGVPLALMALVLVNLAGTFSRGAWLAAALAGAGTAVMVRRAGRPAPGARRVLVTAAAMILLALAFPAVRSRLGTVGAPGELGFHQRLLLYRGVAGHVAAHAPLGSGPRTFQTLFPRYRQAGGQYAYEAHSDILQVAAEAGLPGVAGLLVLLGASLGWGWCRLRSGGPVSAAAAAVPLAFVLAGMTVTTLHYTFLAVPCLVLLGAATAPSAVASSPAGRGALAATVDGTAGSSVGRVPGVVLACAAVASTAFWGALMVADADVAQGLARLSLAGRLSGSDRAAVLRAADDSLAAALRPCPLRDDVPYYRGQVALAGMGRGGAASSPVGAGDPAGPPASALLSRARAFFVEAMRRNPYEAMYVGRLAWVEELRGNLDEAWRLMGEALGGDPWSEELLRQAASLSRRRGDEEGAVRLLRRALESNPQFLSLNPGAYRPVLLDLVRLLEDGGRRAEAAELRSRYGAVLEATPTTGASPP